ncbi:peptidase S16 [Heterostelium album PN500]|uniref:Lon protease homolog n=1 Tax=Heterostelium pallidum (strain ATCC 26659 / Pp 5 / PN500) TaxID=670386 RepID=D3BMY2_HETP5|nr:peptidase S16 [Heterostelium album PN500]EFA77344.1 peptidase S16 [Heterostelium album PN500]|eukprot:XP_020429473.1 peptidase S16 [Heterostelium album PN500]
MNRILLFNQNSSSKTLFNVNKLNSNYKSLYNFNSINNNNTTCKFNNRINNNVVVGQSIIRHYSKKNDKTSTPMRIDDISTISSEAVEALSKIDKQSKKDKDMPINNEVLIYPSQSIHFIGSKGPIHLSSQFTNMLIPNASGKIFVGLFLIKDEFRGVVQADSPLDHKTIEKVHPVGVLAQISSTAFGYHYFEVKQRIKLSDSKESLQSQSSKRLNYFFKIDEFPPQSIQDEEEQSRIDAKMLQIGILIKRYNKMYPECYKSNPSLDYDKHIATIKDPEIFISSIINYYGLNYPTQCQEILEKPSILDRLDLIYNILKNEESLLEQQQKIFSDLESEKVNTQKKLFLNEQLKSIKKQLGVEFDEKEQVVQKYLKRLAKLNVPEGPKKVIEDEINWRDRLTYPSSLEYNTCRNYLDWLTNLPWGLYSPEFFDLKYSKETLDQDHYGLTNIKQRILEFISVGHIKGSVQGKIICFVGPPGTGKTSIGKSIAKCLKRQFFRFSVGGLFDEGEIKGHRRTYIGSMPGKLIQCMKLVQTSNPVILIDEEQTNLKVMIILIVVYSIFIKEIDKIGKRNLGDPSSALLEVLDPEQNSSFVDHYLDVPYDLSRVLFICTANSDQTIPGPLFDRMEVIYLSGYVEEEQIQIVKNFVIPKTLNECGIKPVNEVIKLLVKFYSREVGIRELERLVEKIARKSALELVNGSPDIVVDTENLEDYLGIPSYTSDRYYDVTPIGVVNGLAWSQRGGSTLYIETIAEKTHGSPRLRTTGKLGDVMTESTNIAYTYAKNFLYEIDPENKFFENYSLHMHAPQGSIPKDGPSAGVTMVTSLLSVAMNEPVVNNLGMTGEVTITGKVFTIGGVKEKTIAAKRSGLSAIVIPLNNKIDYEELPDYIRNGIDVKFASEYRDVFEIAFPNKVHLLPPRNQTIDSTINYEKSSSSSETTNETQQQQQQQTTKMESSTTYANGNPFNNLPRLSKTIAGVLAFFLFIGVFFGSQTISYLSINAGSIGPPYFFLWTLFTAGLYEIYLFSGIINIVFLLLLGKYLEPVWGSTEFLKFIMVVNVLSGVGTFFLFTFLFMFSGNPMFLYATNICGFSGIITAFTVALKQLIPEQEITFLFSTIRVKYLASISIAISVVLTLLGLSSGHTLPFIIFGAYFGWFYLRFYQLKGGVKGDRSESFAFSTFFPDPIQPPIQFVSNIFYKIATKLKLVSAHSGTSILPSYNTGQGFQASSGTTTAGGAPVTSVDVDRRRALAMKALEQRMEAQQQQPQNTTTSSPTNPTTQIKPIEQI